MIFIGIAGIVVAIKEPERLNNFTPFLPLGWPKILITMGFTFVAFEGFDLVVLGIKEIHLQRFHRVTPEETIAQNCKKPLVMVKVSKGFLSWAKKII